jgi:hypothetical protein
MISIVIASINEQLLKKIKENIKSTVGVPYEIIAINNLNTGKGICQVYNEASNIAKYEYICFVHEDVSFKTINWGINVIEHLKEQNTGLIGIAGSTYRSLIPSGWFTPFEFGTSDWRLSIYQGKKNETDTLFEFINPLNEKASEVICLDGVFLCTKKLILEKHKFDENLIKGFHGYDIDFSLNVLTSYKVKVIYNIHLEHFSTGEFKNAWLREIDKVQRKWEDLLPSRVGGVLKDSDKKLEKKAAKRFIKEIISKKDISRSEKFALIFFYSKRNINFLKRINYFLKVLLK